MVGQYHRAIYKNIARKKISKTPQIIILPIIPRRALTDPLGAPYPIFAQSFRKSMKFYENLIYEVGGDGVNSCCRGTP